MIFNTEILGNIIKICVILFVLFASIYFLTGVSSKKRKYIKINTIAYSFSASLVVIFIISLFLWGGFWFYETAHDFKDTVVSNVEEHNVALEKEKQNIQDCLSDGWIIYRDGEVIEDFNVRSANLDNYDVEYDDSKKEIYLRPAN